ncbi:MAG: DUF1559 domain-containing protein, partial [Planctomycetaceae bacterium]|nr:DUF1559 domain-containing protein [Planctomycetaceae bacterium]
MSEAQEVLVTAVKNQPKKRGCFCGCLIAILILAFPFWWFCLHTTPLRVSKETTYVLGPMTSDGKRIDYFRAMEEQNYPPEMKTDDNGYRLIVRACGDMARRTKRQSVSEVFFGKPTEELDPEPFRLQVYEKLGLDPNEEPTLKIESAYGHLKKYDEANPADDEKQTHSYQFDRKRFWTFDDFPELKDWLDENSAGLDLLGEAVRKPVFRIPYTRRDENASILERVLSGSEMVLCREWARAAQARVGYRRGIGDIDGAIDDIVTIHRLGRHVGRLGTLVYGLVGIAIEGMGSATTGIGNNPEFPPTKEQIERLMTEINALPPRVALNEVLLSERLFGLATWQDLYWSNDTWQEDGLWGWWINKPPYACLYPYLIRTVDLNTLLARTNKAYDAFDTSDRTLDGKPLEEALKPSWNPLRYLTVRSRSKQIANGLNGALGFAVDAAQEAWRRCECADNMKRLTLALLLYEKEHGTLPEGDWREAVKPYLGDDAEKCFRCPSHRNLADDETCYAMIGGVP